MFARFNKHNSGFTIIELLVVIAIISLLSSIILASLNSARKKAHVAKTISDLRQFYQAIEIYYNDTGIPPPQDHDWNDVCEKAIFVSGNFSHKPSAWAGPYLTSWPKNQWGYTYHWHGCSPGNYSIWIQNVPADEALMLDQMADDGNPATGLITYSAGVVEYYLDKFDFPYVEIIPTSCIP